MSSALVLLLYLRIFCAEACLVMGLLFSTEKDLVVEAAPGKPLLGLFFSLACNCSNSISDLIFKNYSTIHLF